MYSKFFLTLVFCLFTTSTGLADEVRFYVFKTTYNEAAKKPVRFQIKVRTTHLMDYRVDGMDRYDCRVSPKTTHSQTLDTATCTIKGRIVELKSTKEDVKKLLWENYAVYRDDILEIKESSPGLFQVLLGDDRIYHVHLTFPAIVDNSMECQISVVHAKKHAHFACRSEIYPDRKFVVRNVPALGSEYDTRIIFGAQQLNRYGRYDNRDEWRKQNETALAKVQEVLRGFSALKKSKVDKEAEGEQVVALEFFPNAQLPFLAKTGIAEYEGKTFSLENVEIRDKVLKFDRGADRSETKRRRGD